MRRLALGTVQFGVPYGIANTGGQVSRPEASAILGFARSIGMDTLDTAVAYGDSERRLGEIGVGGWRIVSKLPAVPDGCSDVGKWVDESVARCLERLGTRSLYGLLLHRPHQLLERGGDGLFRALEGVRDRGLAAKIGVSVYDPAELDDLTPRFHFDLVQAPLNLVDRRFVDSGWLRRLAGEGTETHVRSVFLQGLLLMPREARPRTFDRWAKTWERFEYWLLEAGLTPMQACLRYAMSFPEIGRVVVGVDSISQLLEIVDAIDEPSAAAPAFPNDIAVNDPELVNPGRWK